MLEEHKDNPSNTLNWVGELSPYEKDIFQKGYLIALQKLIEQLVDSKYKIGTKIMDEECTPTQKALLESRIHILDIYENHYSILIRELEGRTELQP